MADGLDSIDIAAPKAGRQLPAEGGSTALDPVTVARYTRFEELPVLARFGLPAELLLDLNAAFIGCTRERLASITAQQQDVVEQAAGELLRGKDFRERINRLPFESGDRVVTVGDSITADRLGWSFLLAECLRQSGRDDVTVVNLAVSGHTTSDTIAMFDLVVAAHPTWILQMLGTNDARRHGLTSRVRMLSASETARNIEAIQDLVRLETTAQLIMITSPPMNQTMIDENTQAVPEPVWRAKDMEQLADLVVRLDPATIDLYSQVQTSQPGDFWLPDGIHPTIAGQTAILSIIVGGLSRWAGQTS
jgi:lysophospholipase L1-like esterase